MVVELVPERTGSVVLLNVSRRHWTVSAIRGFDVNDDHNPDSCRRRLWVKPVFWQRVAYLLQSHQAQAEELLLLAFGREARLKKWNNASTVKLVAVSREGASYHFPPVRFEDPESVETERVLLSLLSLRW